MKHTKTLVAALAAFAFALLGALSPAPAATLAGQPDPHPEWCYYSVNSVSKLKTASSILGHDFDCALAFTDAIPAYDPNNAAYTGWARWEKPWLLTTKPGEDLDFKGWKNAKAGRHLVVAHSLIPQGMPSDWRERGAAGEYDAHFVTYAKNMVAAGLGDSTIRLAHEPNGTWFHHSVGDTLEQRQAWALFWARAVRAMRSVEGAGFTFELNPNAGYRSIPLAEYYPGDDVVDSIGIDQYDSTAYGTISTLRGAARWNALRDQPGGIAEIARFARAHGKPISIPEAGLVATDRYGAGDDPVFVLSLTGFLREASAPLPNGAPGVTYVAYFDKNVGGTLRLEEVPLSMLAWRDMMHDWSTGQ